MEIHCPADLTLYFPFEASNVKPNTWMLTELRKKHNFCLLHRKSKEVYCLTDGEDFCCECAIVGSHQGHRMIFFSQLQLNNETALRTLSANASELRQFFEKKNVSLAQIGKEMMDRNKAFLKDFYKGITRRLKQHIFADFSKAEEAFMDNVSYRDGLSSSTEAFEQVLKLEEDIQRLRGENGSDVQAAADSARRLQKLKDRFSTTNELVSEFESLCQSLKNFSLPAKVSMEDLLKSVLVDSRKINLLLSKKMSESHILQESISVLNPLDQLTTSFARIELPDLPYHLKDDPSKERKIQTKRSLLSKNLEFETLKDAKSTPILNQTHLGERSLVLESIELKRGASCINLASSSKESVPQILQTCTALKTSRIKESGEFRKRELGTLLNESSINQANLKRHLIPISVEALPLPKASSKDTNQENKKVSNPGNNFYKNEEKTFEKQPKFSQTLPSTGQTIVIRDTTLNRSSMTNLLTSIRDRKTPTVKVYFDKVTFECDPIVLIREMLPGKIKNHLAFDFKGSNVFLTRIETGKSLIPWLKSAKISVSI